MGSSVGADIDAVGLPVSGAAGPPGTGGTSGTDGTSGTSGGPDSSMDGAETCATFANGVLMLSSVEVEGLPGGTQFFDAEMELAVPITDPLRLNLISANLLEAAPGASCASFSNSTLRIPSVEVLLPVGSLTVTDVEMELAPLTDPLQFILISP